jgi:hypothetical protein
MRPRTCDGCRAIGGTWDDPHCQLRYPLAANFETNKHGIRIFKVRPLGKCPKPRTYRELSGLRGPVGTPTRGPDTVPQGAG